MSALISILDPIQTAHAHHFMGEEESFTLVDAFLSGLAHPIIGLDHFAFILVIGAIAAQTRDIPIIFILATALGTLLLDLSWTLSERAIGLSVLLGGLFLCLRHHLSPALWIVFATLAGLSHGYAYGQAVIGAQATHLLAYLSGFTLTQAAIIFMTAWLLSRSTSALTTQLGGAIACVGILFLLIL